MINKKSVLSQKVLTKTGSLLLAGTASLHAHTEELENTTVLANRTETFIDKVGSSVTILDPKELKEQGIFYIDDALKFVPGVISPSLEGQRGSGSGIFLRGTTTKYTQIRVDGMRVSGSNIANNNFLGGSNLNGLSRVEILRGPQGAIYGGDAIGGVLGIYTEKGTEVDQGSFSLEAGSFNSFKSALGLQGSFDKLAYSLSISHEQTDNDLPNNEFDQLSYTLRLDYDVNENLYLGMTLRSFNSDFTRPDYSDPLFGKGAEDDTDSILGTLFAELQINEVWTSKLTLGIYDEEYYADSAGSNSFFTTEGQKYAAYWDNTLEWNDQHTTTAGLVYEKTDYAYATFSPFFAASDDRDNDQYGIYLNHSWDVTDALTLNGGIRWEDYDTYGDEVTWRTAVAYRIESTNTKLRASAGKGFRPPSYIELYGFGGGSNFDLKAEQSFGWDASFDQEFCDGQYHISATYFENRIQDQIVSTFGAPTENTSGVTNTKGLEVSARGSWLEDRLSATLSYTYLDESLADQPRNSAGLRIHGDITKQLSSGVNLTYLDERSFGGEDLDSHLVTSLYANYKITPNIRVNARVENLFDEDYNYYSGFGEIYPARGRGVFAGLTYTW